MAAATGGHRGFPAALEVLVRRLELGPDRIDEADDSRRRFGLREQAVAFVMGGSRDNSKDSRYFGFVPREKIVGRVDGTLASFDKNRWCKPRFGRFGSGLDG
ncbi:MAG: hypothetical protein B9S38_11970 [Verrucomicrobiia bacterium Tous-C4TDCM]|nr:MAG: hypothetical protein B9S38_11970 [Verrucomicrobiae bacterium Tous-C4TDCM]